MRVILDECLPRRLGADLTGHMVTTVPQAGWAQFKNGKLLARIAGNFDVFVTVDKNIPYQQKIARLPFGIVVLRAHSNKIQDLRPLVPQILNALSVLQPGQTVTVKPIVGDHP
jgi:predicted nuclease of predicted toxin-antitoxin system